MNRLSPWLIIVAALEGVCAAPAVWGYDSEIHQQLTFIAARQFNRCAQSQPGVERLSALDSRYIVKANVAQADANVFVRMFRWNYYNRADQTGRSAWYVVDTRFHDHFAELAENIGGDEGHRRRLRDLGRLINYIQNVTSPPHAVPVYMGRWWRFSVGDRFNRYVVDTESIEQEIANHCASVMAIPESYQAVLVDAANDTAASVQAQIQGFPTTWESYWQFAREADEFGEYGPAGNAFGERTEFRCGADERCLLLKNDPLYSDFAVNRHVAAVLATMRAMVLLQTGSAKAL